MQDLDCAPVRALLQTRGTLAFHPDREEYEHHISHIDATALAYIKMVETHVEEENIEDALDKVLTAALCAGAFTVVDAGRALLPKPYPHTLSPKEWAVVFNRYTISEIAGFLDNNLLTNTNITLPFFGVCTRLSDPQYVIETLAQFIPYDCILQKKYRLHYKSPVMARLVCDLLKTKTRQQRIYSEQAFVNCVQNADLVGAIVMLGSGVPIPDDPEQTIKPHRHAALRWVRAMSGLSAHERLFVHSLISEPVLAFENATALRLIRI